MAKGKKIRAKSLGETRKFAEDLARSLSSAKRAGQKAVVVGLLGDLGSGKTSFVQGVGEALGVKEKITSPTFVIAKRYPLKDQNFKNMFHLDAYRFQKPEEVLALKWDEIIGNPGNLVFVEWPEKLGEFLPEDSKKLCFTFIDPDTREIEEIC